MKINGLKNRVTGKNCASLCRSSSINLLLLFAHSVIDTRKHHLLSLNHARNVPGPCSAVSLHVTFSQSSKYFCCFPLNQFLTAPVFLEWEWWEMSYGLTEVLPGEDDFEFLLLLVTWGHSLNHYRPGKLFLWIFSSSLDFWAITPKHFNFHFLRLNSNFIYYLCLYAQRRLFRIFWTIQQGILVTWGPFIWIDIKMLPKCAAS